MSNIFLKRADNGLITQNGVVKIHTKSADGILNVYQIVSTSMLMYDNTSDMANHVYCDDADVSCGHYSLYLED